MERKIALSIICQKYPYAKSFEKLTKEENNIMVQFIEKNDGLGHLEFEYAVNRMFLSGKRTKNWSIIQDLLVSCNSRVHTQRKE